MRHVILAMDLSLNCPGLAVLRVCNKKISLLHASSLDQSKSTLPAAYKIDLIRQWVEGAISKYSPDVFVMERGFSRFPKVTQTLFRVVGVVENTVVRLTGVSDVETIPPKEVKKLIALDGGADKQAVSQGLTPYLGSHDYRCDDESDAAAVGVAYALLKGWITQKQNAVA